MGKKINSFVTALLALASTNALTSTSQKAFLTDTNVSSTQEVSSKTPLYLEKFKDSVQGKDLAWHSSHVSHESHSSHVSHRSHYSGY